MAEESKVDSLDVPGKTDLGTGEAQQPQTDSADGQEQPQAEQQTTEKGAGLASEDAFFDPTEYEQVVASLPEEAKAQVEKYKKSLQGAYTKKTQALAKDREKVEAYDAFSQNPLEQIQNFAQRMGYQLVPQGQGQQQEAGPKEPQTWEDVYKVAEERAYKRIKEELGPTMQSVQDLRKSTLERYLDDNAPDWRTYEDDMMTTLKKHPSLVNDPLGLYKMSVPSHVLESRATQQALKKLQDKSHSQEVSGASTTTKEPQGGLPDSPVSFDDAVKYAKAQLAKDGIKAPAGT